MSFHLAQKLHAYINGLFQPEEAVLAREMQAKATADFKRLDLDSDTGRDQFANGIANDVLERLSETPNLPDEQSVFALVLHLLDYEGMFELPKFDWNERNSTSDYWALRDELKIQQALLENFDQVRELIIITAFRTLHPIASALPSTEKTDGKADGIIVPTRRIEMIAKLGDVTENVYGAFFDIEIEEQNLFPRLRDRLERNVIAASGGNPDNVTSFNRTPKQASKSDIGDPDELVGTYLAGTPLARLFEGDIDFVIPNTTRFEHHHIVAGTGHGKTQTLQALITKDLDAVAKGKASVIVIDSQGDLINNLMQLKQFAPNHPLHDRVVIIDPTDVEYPVSLNLFDVGMERLNSYPMLERERLTNSILELYDFVLGSLLDAGMTQKQNVIFRYVTRLMLHIPDATIHTFRELMEPGSEVKFASSIAKLTGTAKHFFETEFNSKEFKQTKQQVLRRLWGILENQTFERMFSHPRSKLDLYSEMNAGKVILINTAKDLLKENGTEIFGRFFIALIAQAAQERATLPEHERLPTFVYVDEAADYFDANIGLILSQARKQNVGMVLAHQYLGQLDPKLQEAFSANTSIKFAGGVSNKDARTLGSMMGCEPALIETQAKGSFACSVRGQTKGAVSLKFPFGQLERMDKMTVGERDVLRSKMREKYAVHYSELMDDGEASNNADVDEGENTANADQSAENSQKQYDPDTPDSREKNDPDKPNTDPSPDW